jgi:hypothetical protein
MELDIDELLPEVSIKEYFNRCTANIEKEDDDVRLTRYDMFRLVIQHAFIKGLEAGAKKTMDSVQKEIKRVLS